MYVTLDNYRNLDFDTIDINEEWNLPEKKENLMHSIHAYPAKFPAFITTKAIQKADEYNITVNTIADIFCGCGTVAFETVRNGKNFWGCDINPVATLIAETKSHLYDDAILHQYYDKIINRFSSVVADKADKIYANERIHYWFDDEHIDDLLRLRVAIYDVVEDVTYRKFFLCGFSNILRSCSRWLTKSIKPQIDPNKKPKDVISAYSFHIRHMMRANLDNDNRNQGLAEIYTYNILDKEFTHPFVDLVITSPPYVTSYEYADLHQLSTMWLGYTDDFRLFRQGTIGSLYSSSSFDENKQKLNSLGLEIVSNLHTTDNSKMRAVAQYYVDMQLAIKKVSQMLRPGGACFFIIGNTEYKGIKIDNAKHLTECLLNEGFSQISIDRRKISNKILTPYRDDNGKFARASNSSKKVYSEEFVIMARR